MRSAWFDGQNKKYDSEERAGVSPALLFVVLCLVLSIVFLLLPIKKALLVKDIKTNEILLTLPADKGELVDIEFTHSVNLSPVIDRYQLDEKSLILRSTYFKAYGAGIPILDDGLGKSFKQTEDGFEINEIDLHRDSIPIMLQAVPDHRIIYRNKEIHLLDVAKSGTVIVMTVGNVSFFKYYLTQLKTP